MEMLNELVVFAHVVESGSFSAGARQLGVTTSAASRQVTRLEDLKMALASASRECDLQLVQTTRDGLASYPQRHPFAD